MELDRFITNFANVIDVVWYLTLDLKNKNKTKREKFIENGDYAQNLNTKLGWRKCKKEKTKRLVLQRHAVYPSSEH